MIWTGFNELDNERRSVLHLMMRTHGRRGEIIKEEEILKEFLSDFSRTLDKIFRPNLKTTISKLS